MARMTLRAKGQLTIPEEIRAAARLEDGDLFDAEITEEGILLRPRKVIDATQAWFWTQEPVDLAAVESGRDVGGGGAAERGEQQPVIDDDHRNELLNREVGIDLPERRSDISELVQI